MLTIINTKETAALNMQRCWRSSIPNSYKFLIIKKLPFCQKLVSDRAGREPGTLALERGIGAKSCLVIG